MPCFVYKVRVCTYGIYFDTHFLKFAVLVSHIDQFGRTYERKVGRIEEKDGPFALDIFATYCLETTILKSLYFEFGYL